MCQEKTYELTKLQEKYDVLECNNHQRRNATQKSRIPMSQRVPLRATDGNAHMSVGVLAGGGSTRPLVRQSDAMSHTRTRSQRRQT